MPKKCESCRHYRNLTDWDFSYGACISDAVLGEMVDSAEAIDILSGRKICDREGDGIFVHFEPIEPTEGAAVRYSVPSEEILAQEWNPVQPLVQITREPVITRMSGTSNPPPFAHGATA